MTAVQKQEALAALAPHLHNGDEAPTISFPGLFDPVPGNNWDTLTQFSKTRVIDPVLPGKVAAAVSLLSIDDSRNPSLAPVVIRKRRAKDQCLEQIWMPGGACGRRRMLGRQLSAERRPHNDAVGVQVAVSGDRLGRGYLARLRGSLAISQDLSIPYERTGFFRKLLRRRERDIASADKGAEGFQQLHPLFDLLRGRQLKIRGVIRTDEPGNVPPDLPAYAGDQELYSSAVAMALDRD